MVSTLVPLRLHHFESQEVAPFTLLHLRSANSHPFREVLGGQPLTLHMSIRTNLLCQPSKQVTTLLKETPGCPIRFPTARPLTSLCSVDEPQEQSKSGASPTKWHYPDCGWRLTIDLPSFCEEDFIISGWFGEFVNTVSNLAYSRAVSTLLSIMG